MFLSLCHSSHSSADAYDLFRVLDNQQKKDKILPADTDVKQQLTCGPYNQFILLFMCRQWTEAIRLFRYDFKNSDVRCRAVFSISLKRTKVSKENTNSMSLSDCTPVAIQTVCHCQTVHQLQYKQYVTVRLYTICNTNSMSLSDCTPVSNAVNFLPSWSA